MEELGAGGGYGCGGVCGRFVGETHFYFFVEVGFMEIGDFEARQAVAVVEIEAPLVEQQLDIARGVDVAVEVDVAVGESVTFGAAVSERPGA